MMTWWQVYIVVATVISLFNTYDYLADPKNRLFFNKPFTAIIVFVFGAILAPIALFDIIWRRLKK